MGAAPPSAVLSESLQAVVKGRRVRTAVFFTFSFDPGFFETEILPVVLDLGLSQVQKIRLAQLEDELRHGLDHVEVYYDPRGLLPSSDTPRLDVRRVPALVKGGAGGPFFHPKNILLLTESASDDPHEPPAKELVVATLSANLTEAGWWRNVECCHVEVVSEGAKIGFRDDLLGLFRSVRDACPGSASHQGLDAVHRFVLGCRQRERIVQGALPTRLFGGRHSFVDYLAEETRGRLEGLNLEVIAPYVDDSDAKPLKALLEVFAPRECRVLLPRDDRGRVACSPRYFDTVRKLDGVSWATLPKAILQSGRTEHAVDRFVHAKVYRFFHPHRRYEALVVGSLNLTTAAHKRGGNLESAVVVEPELNQVPDWWMARLDGKRPKDFAGAGEDDVATRSPCIALTLTFNWESHRAEVEWRDEKPSPAFELYAAGVSCLAIRSMDPGQKLALSDAEAKAVEQALEVTALFTARADGYEDGPLLVREEGMAWKPSILLSLSAADILRYWSALTREQRLALLEHIALRDPALAGALGACARRDAAARDSFFDNFAQIFQAFENVEQAVKTALQNGRESEAVHRLLGEKYDSLPQLLKSVSKPDSEAEPLTRYLIALCARQTLNEVRRAEPEFARTNRARFDELSGLTDTTNVRARLKLGAVDDPGAFLDWFETWFVRRATPPQEVN